MQEDKTVMVKMMKYIRSPMPGFERETSKKMAGVRRAQLVGVRQSDGDRVSDSGRSDADMLSPCSYSQLLSAVQRWGLREHTRIQNTCTYLEPFP
jgi:hypothetical protein